MDIDLRCEVCGDAADAGMRSIPYVPGSAAYCSDCAADGLIPYPYLVALQVSLSGAPAVPGYLRAQKASLDRVRVTPQQMLADVAIQRVTSDLHRIHDQIEQALNDVGELPGMDTFRHRTAKAIAAIEPLLVYNPDAVDRRHHSRD